MLLKKARIRGVAMSLEIPEEITEPSEKCSTSKRRRTRSIAAARHCAQLPRRAVACRLFCEDMLDYAYKLAKANRGAPGVAFAQIEEARAEVLQRLGSSG